GHLNVIISVQHLFNPVEAIPVPRAERGGWSDGAPYRDDPPRRGQPRRRGPDASRVPPEQPQQRDRRQAGRCRGARIPVRSDSSGAAAGPSRSQAPEGRRARGASADPRRPTHEPPAGRDPHLVESRVGPGSRIRAAREQLHPEAGRLHPVHRCGARDPDVPFIIVSGTMGEDVAVEAMHAGANDYFIKGKTRRLAAVLDRELKQAAGRSARRELERAFAALRDVASAVGRLPEPGAVAALATKHARALLRADVAVLFAWDADAAVLRMLASDGPPQVVRTATVRPGEGAAGLAFDRRESVFVEDYRSWRLALPHQGDTIKSALAVPLLIGDRAIGALTVAGLEPRRFTQDQIELLSLLASEVGPTLEAGRL